MPIRPLRRIAAVVATLLIAGTLTASPAAANPAGTGLVIGEVYLNGGSAGATYLNKFVELGNPTAAPILLDGLSLQYRATGTTSVFGQVSALSGTVPAGGTYLIQLPANSTNGAALPTPDATLTLNPSGTAGAIALAVGTGALTGVDGPVTGNPAVIDLVGWGSAAKSFETTPVPPGLNSVTASLNRTSFADSDANAADFLGAAPTPTPSGSTEPEPDPEPADATIAEIQGTVDTSPLDGELVTTTGVVTAAYPTGGFSGFYLQTGGSGGDPAVDPTPGASDGVFVFGSAVTETVQIGDSLQVTGQVSEFRGLTEITPRSAADVQSIGALDPVKTTETPLPATASAREALEGMLLHPTGGYTVTDVFALNTFGSIGLAFGDGPLLVPTEVATPGAAAEVVDAENAGRKVVLDDGSSVSFLSTANGGANKNIPLPWLTRLVPIRVGYSATFTEDVIFDYRNDGWNFQPVAQLTAGDVNGVRPATFAGERPAAPEPVGGDIKIGTFNVLNYFTTTGAAYEAANPTIDCTSFDDREGNPIGVNSCTGDAGPRGAWDDASLVRQQEKIVKAINGLGADVVSLEEIENSAKFGIDRDTALAALVAALNAVAGAGTWDYVRSPAALPPIGEQDVIRTAFIYKPAVVTPAGPSTVLVGSAAFANARQPLAQAFTPVVGRLSDTFLVIVNHFKSKSSGVDDLTGQGLANPDRIAQAHALVDFATAMTATYGTDRVFLTGDFNAYSMEDPVQVLKDAGYLDLDGQFTDKETYSFGGESGSLDHVFASSSVAGSVTGLDVWQINAEESIAYEYSRYNYNATNFYVDDVYRASDHDPVVLGLDVQAPLIASTTTASVAPVSYGTAPAVSVTVAAAGATPTGTVTVSAGGQPLGSAPLSGGAATVALPADLTPGNYDLTVSYGGSDTVAASQASVLLEVRALPSLLVAAALPPIVRTGQGTTVYAVVATSAGGAPGGTVQVYLNGTQLASAPVASGVARVPVPAFPSRGLKLLTVSYTGTDTVAGSATVALVLVR